MSFLLCFSAIALFQWRFYSAADKMDIPEILKNGAMLIGCIMLLCTGIICESLEG